MNLEKLSFEDTLWVLERLQLDPETVLIGGQALNLWCAVLPDADDELAQYKPFVSKDVDFQGDRATAERCAALLGGKVEDISARSPKLAGVVSYTDRGGAEREIDFLTVAHGLDARKVVEASVPVPVATPSGADVTVRVMNPIHCMQSRVHNVVSLPSQYANDHGIRQLRASIVCARSYLRELARGNVRRALKQIKRVFAFARGRVASQLYAAHGIEVFDAVLCEGPLPEKFLSDQYLRMKEQVVHKRATFLRTLAARKRS